MQHLDIRSVAESLYCGLAGWTKSKNWSGNNSWNASVCGISMTPLRVFWNSEDSVLCIWQQTFSRGQEMRFCIFLAVEMPIKKAEITFVRHNIVLVKHHHATLMDIKSISYYYAPSVPFPALILLQCIKTVPSTFVQKFSIYDSWLVYKLIWSIRILNNKKW